MKQKNILKIILSVSTMIALSACSSSSDGDTTPTEPTEDPVNPAHVISLSAVAVDGYISNATVCLDIDKSSTCDATEPTTTTASDGTFAFKNIEVLENTFVPILVIGGEDTAIGKAFTASLRHIINSSTTNNQSLLLVTPLTELVATVFLESNTQDKQTLDDAKSTVAQSFNLSTSELMSDPMQSIKVFAKTQELQQIKALIETSVKKASGDSVNEETVKQETNEALITQIKESSITVDIEKLLTKVELISKVTLPNNEKAFIVAQVNEITDVLENISLTVNRENMNTLQANLENKLEGAFIKIDESTEDVNISLIALDEISPSLPTEDPLFDTAPTVPANVGFPTPPTTMRY